MDVPGSLATLAEIAGVFVGFGALIAVRTGGAIEIAEIAYIRTVVSMGTLTVAAALAPPIVALYGLRGHEVWLVGSLLVLVGWSVLSRAMSRTPEYRTNWSAELQADRVRPRWLIVADSVVMLLYLAASFLSPVVIVLGLAPDLDPALYVTAVALILVGAGWSLLYLVFAQHGRSTASDRAQDDSRLGPQRPGDPDATTTRA